MIVWNIRGLNKAVKFCEIDSHLTELNVSVAALLETRVKKDNKDRVRKRLGRNWCYLDNYDKHDNGRIWALWNDQKVNIQLVSSSISICIVGYILWMAG